MLKKTPSFRGQSWHASEIPQTVFVVRWTYKNGTIGIQRPYLKIGPAKAHATRLTQDGYSAEVLSYTLVDNS